MIDDTLRYAMALLEMERGAQTTVIGPGGDPFRSFYAPVMFIEAYAQARTSDTSRSIELRVPRGFSQVLGPKVKVSGLFFDRYKYERESIRGLNWQDTSRFEEVTVEYVLGALKDNGNNPCFCGVDRKLKMHHLSDLVKAITLYDLNSRNGNNNLLEAVYLLNGADN